MQIHPLAGACLYVLLACGPAWGRARPDEAAEKGDRHGNTLYPSSSQATTGCGASPLFQQSPNEPHQRPGERLVVWTASGREFRGDFDTRTDVGRLWLRSDYGRTAVLRPIRWDRIERIALGESQYTGDEFQAAFLAVAAAMPSLSSPPASEIRLVGTRETLEESPPELLPDLLPVQLLRIDAGIANWDSDVEVDGLWLQLEPLSEWGTLVPVDATLSVDLIGLPTGPVNRPERPIRLGRWSRQVNAADFGPCGALYRLAFQAIHPAFEPAIAPDALAHVRLSVPGRGVFEASECLSRLRPYCAFRDEAYRATGRSFLPLEQTGRSQPSW